MRWMRKALGKGKRHEKSAPTNSVEKESVVAQDRAGPTGAATGAADIKIVGTAAALKPEIADHSLSDAETAVLMQLPGTDLRIYAPSTMTEEKQTNDALPNEPDRKLLPVTATGASSAQSPTSWGRELIPAALQTSQLASTQKTTDVSAATRVSQTFCGICADPAITTCATCLHNDSGVLSIADTDSHEEPSSLQGAFIEGVEPSGAPGTFQLTRMDSAVSVALTTGDLASAAAMAAAEKATASAVSSPVCSVKTFSAVGPTTAGVKIPTAISEESNPSEHSAETLSAVPRLGNCVSPEDRIKTRKTSERSTFCLPKRQGNGSILKRPPQLKVMSTIASTTSELGGMPPNASWVINIQNHIARTWNDLLGQTGPVPSDEIARSPSLVERLRPVTAPLGFSFSPAGLLLPYHLGVAKCLEDFGVLTPATPIAGASAGALAVATLTCGVPVERTLEVLCKVNHNLRSHGAARRLHAAIDAHLDQLLPTDAAARFNQREGRAAVSFTQVWPLPKGHNVACFKDSSDLKECLIASCNIPFYFSTWPTVNCRGFPAVDGYFATSRRKFGCPSTTAARDIRVLPFSPKRVRVRFPERDCISPDLQAKDQELAELTDGQFPNLLRSYLKSFPAPLKRITNLISEAISDTAETSKIERNLKKQMQQQPNRSHSIKPDKEAAVRNLEVMWGILDVSRVWTAVEDVPAAVTTDEGTVSAPVTPENSVNESEFRPAGSPQLAASQSVPCQSASQSLPSRSASSQPVSPQSVLVPASPTAGEEDCLPSLKYTIRQMLAMALDAGETDDTVGELYDLGRADALRWLQLEVLANDTCLPEGVKNLQQSFSTLLSLRKKSESSTKRLAM